jgi:outer membrane protein assembly factor BamB
LVVLEDAIYLSAGTECFVFNPASGENTGCIGLPQDLSQPWQNVRVSGRYLVGSSGANVVCVDRYSGKLLWQFETDRPSLQLVAGGNKVFVAELTDPRRGEDGTRDGRLLAIDIATGRQLWRQPGGDSLRYSPLLDIVVTPTALYQAGDGQPLPWDFEGNAKRLVVQGNGLPKPGLPGLVTGSKLLTGNDDNLTVYELTTGDTIGNTLKWARRGCTGTRASTHLLTTRFRGNSAWIDLESREITPLLGVRPGCGVNNNLYPANGVLNIPNLTAGCTCNYAPVSAACVPASVVRRSDAP